MNKGLVAGIYLAERENCASHVMFELGSAVHHRVTQRWAALRPGNAGYVHAPFTVRVIDVWAPKFAILNELIGQVEDFDWVIICDDDVELPVGFVDDFLKLAERLDF